MRGRVILVLLLSSFLFAATAFPQCDYRLLYSGEYRASMFDISIDGNDLWVATGYGVRLYDRSVDPPRLAGSVALPGLTRIVRGSNGIAYAAGTAGISVVRSNGKSLQFVRTVPAGVVNDLILRTTALFAATPSGIAGFTLTDALNPIRSAAVFATSSANVTSLAAAGDTLYAADGDASVEVFSIAVPSSPQKNATITSLARSSNVELIGSRLFVSDGIRTEVFNVSGATFTSVGSLPFPSTSIADAGSNVIVLAGNDRQFRVLDALVPENFVELYETEVAPTSGTVNRITALRIAGGRLYAAAGDAGLLTYDVSRFTAPFPLRAYGIGQTTSVVTLSNAVYAGRAATGIQELTRSSSGNLVLARQWSASNEKVHDGNGGFLISSTGAALHYWTLSSTIPTLLATATFRSPVRTAFLTSMSSALALLEDGTLWTADLAQTSPQPVRVAASVGVLSQLARSDRGAVATEVSADGNTTIHYWAGTDLNAAPANTPVSGAATALAINGSSVAVFTFRGISVGTAGGTLSFLPSSNTAVITGLQIANGKVLALSEQSTVRVWDLSTGKLERDITIPGPANAFHAAQDSTVAGFATAAGVATVNYGTSSTLPVLLAQNFSNAYYKKAVTSTNRLYAFDGRVVDIYELGSTPAPRWLSSFFSAGAIDVAASDTMLFVLSSSGLVTEYSAAGVLLRSKLLDEGNDVVPLSITAVAGAPWVSFSRGCTTGTCEKRTVVLDPGSLVRTASLTGGAVDVTSTSTRAYAIFDLPSETGLYNLADRLHPSEVAKRTTDVPAVSIAYNNGTVYLLADKMYAYSESSLTRTGEQLTSISPASGADVVVDGSCATIAGRSTAAETYALPAFTTIKTLAVPGTIRSVALAGSRIVILTDYSIEVWSATAAQKAGKRRVAP